MMAVKDVPERSHWPRRSGVAAAILCLATACACTFAVASFAKNAPQKNAPAKPKSQQQLLEMLDNFEKSPPTNNRMRSQYQAPGRQYGTGRRSMRMQSFPQGSTGLRQGAGGQPALLQMLHQRSQGSNSGAGANQLLQLMRQKMQVQGNGGAGAAQSGMMQMLRQRMQGMSAPPNRSGGLSNPGSSLLPAPSIQRPAANPHFQRGSLGLLKSTQTHSAAKGNTPQDLESLMNDQYGR